MMEEGIQHKELSLLQTGWCSLCLAKTFSAESPGMTCMTKQKIIFKMVFSHLKSLYVDSSVIEKEETMIHV